MATKTWKPTAAAVRQISTITVGGTWLATETGIVTCNNKALTITVATGATGTAAVAKSIRDAIESSVRLDGSGSNANTSNFGGKEHGEFHDFTASIDASDTSVVILTGEPGVPFTVTVDASGSTSGTLVLATTQTPTGPNHWDNANNWEEGTVPAEGDSLVFADSDVSVLYGLPTHAGNIQVDIDQHQSFTGWIGLRPVNTNTPSKPYTEYRQKAVQLTDGATPAASTWRFGLGVGVGSRHIRIAYEESTTNATIVVYNTGPHTDANNYALNLAGTIFDFVTIHRGSVRMAPEAESATSLEAESVTIGSGSVSPADTIVEIESNIVGGACAYMVIAGRIIIRSGATAGTDTVTQYGGEIVFDDYVTTASTVLVYGGRSIWNATQTIAALTITDGGVFDASGDSRAFTVTACDLYKGATLFDPHARITFTAGYDQNQCRNKDVTVDVGHNRRLTPGAVA